MILTSPHPYVSKGGFFRSNATIYLLFRSRFLLRAPPRLTHPSPLHLRAILLGNHAPPLHSLSLSFLGLRRVRAAGCALFRFSSSRSMACRCPFRRFRRPLRPLQSISVASDRRPGQQADPLCG